MVSVETSGSSSSWDGGSLVVPFDGDSVVKRAIGTSIDEIGNAVAWVLSSVPSSRTEAPSVLHVDVGFAGSDRVDGLRNIDV